MKLTIKNPDLKLSRRPYLPTKGLLLLNDNFTDHAENTVLVLEDTTLRESVIEGTAKRQRTRKETGTIDVVLMKVVVAGPGNRGL